MQRRLLFALALGWLVPVAPARAQLVDESDAESYKSAAAPDKGERTPELAKAVTGVVDRTNAFRKEEGRQGVKRNDQLAAAAQYFADYMARTDRYGHTADGSSPSDRARKHGYDYCLIAENIANAYDSAGFTTESLAEQFFTGWKKSPGHRRNMLDPDVLETGVAVARSEKTGYYYAVQMFGRPKSAAIEFSVANESPDEVTYEIGGKSFTLQPRFTRTHARCRPADLIARWPEGQKEAKVRPEKGDRFVVRKESDGFRLTKE